MITWSSVEESFTHGQGLTSWYMYFNSITCKGLFLLYSFHSQSNVERSIKRPNNKCNCLERRHIFMTKSDHISFLSLLLLIRLTKWILSSSILLIRKYWRVLSTFYALNYWDILYPKLVVYNWLISKLDQFKFRKHNRNNRNPLIKKIRKFYWLL